MYVIVAEVTSVIEQYSTGNPGYPWALWEGTSSGHAYPGGQNHLESAPPGAQLALTLQQVSRAVGFLLSIGQFSSL